VLLIMCDQLRADHTGFGGSPYIRTPHLDALAASGTVFPEARVANPICMPNRASLLTGRAPSSHGVTANADALLLSTNTLPRQLRGAGYRTSLVGKADLQNGLRRGFDPVTTQAPALGDPYPPGWDRIEDPDRYLHGRLPDPADFYGFEHIALTLGHADMVGGHHLRWALAKGASPDELNRAGPHHAIEVNPDWWQIYQPRLSAELYSTTFVTEATIAAVDALSHQEAPWFIQCSFPDPHHPFTAPGHWHHRHRAGDMELPATFNDYGVDAPSHLNGFRLLRPSAMPVQMFGPTPEQLRAAAAAEAGAIEFIDHGIGRIVAALNDVGAAGNTVVVFTSDHGDMFGDHGLMLKGMMHYSGCLRVPLAIAGPGVPAGTAITLASTLDITPTLLDLAGVDPYDGIHGVSLVPALRDPVQPLRDSVYVEEELPQANRFPFPVPASARTLITERYRLTRYPGSPLGELYDLTNDPTESVNRWNDPACGSQRRDLLEQLLDTTIAHSMPARLGPLDTTTRPPQVSALSFDSASDER
jgi:arylsulfatase A-like enzyme